jgi:2-phosphoglycerate kinase
MIYLIGGPPRSGKTMLAKKLATHLRIGWISSDFLEGIIREYTPARKQAALFPKNAIRSKTDGTNDDMYSRFSFVQIARAYIAQGKTCRRAIEALVEDCVKENHDFVIEGHQIHPKLAARLIERFPKKIRSVFLVKKNESALVAGFIKNTAKSDWVLEKTKKNETLQKIAKMLSYFGGYTEREAAKYRLPFWCMDDNFLKKIIVIEKALAKR